jgi:hypothetical protein
MASSAASFEERTFLERRQCRLNNNKLTKKRSF